MEDRILVIGLGSMGKRRIRNLQHLGYTNIAGFDIREDRRAESIKKYGITAFDVFQLALDDFKPAVFIISVPPDLHHIYMKAALQLGIPSFIEASVVDTDLSQIIEDAFRQKVLLAPSCTLFFHPAIKAIHRILQSGDIGAISNVLYHSGQYLPDWHTYESVGDYYVSNPETGGCREIVPFELSWMTQVFGFPTMVAGICKKTIEIEGAPAIYDTCNTLMDYQDFMIMLTVDVVSRVATRRLTINGSLKQLTWDWNEPLVRTFNPVTGQNEETRFELLDSEAGYNKNITEQMYIDEMDSFMRAALHHGTFENTLENDYRILNILYAVEKSYGEKKFVVTE